MATYSYNWLGDLGRQEFHKHFKAICALHKCPMTNTNRNARTAAVHAFATAMINRGHRGQAAKGSLAPGLYVRSNAAIAQTINRSLRGRR